MTLDEIRAALMGRLDEQWKDGGGPLTPIMWPNAHFRAPRDQAWIRPSLRAGRAMEAEKGEDGLGLRAGVLVLGVFVPTGTGTARALELAGRLEAIFRRVDLSGVMCGEPYSAEIGDDGKGFFMVSVNVPFQAWIGD